MTVRLLQEGDLATAHRVMDHAFSTFLGVPDSPQLEGESSHVHSRWRADPMAAFAAEVDGEVVGSNFATNWGSFAFFGPLTVDPDHWGQGIAQRLLDVTMDRIESWGVRHSGLFTFPQSPKHIHLYQKYGFWPRYLTPIMSKPVEIGHRGPGWSRFSELTESARDGCLKECRAVTDGSFDGLDLRQEIRAVLDQSLGDTVLIRNGSRLVGFAVCHAGAASEAVAGTCYVKFGAVAPGAAAEPDFDRLLDACEAFAIEKEVTRLVAGTNVGRHLAYRHLLARGFRTGFQGIAMERDNQPGYNRPDVYIIDDWR